MSWFGGLNAGWFGGQAQAVAASASPGGGGSGGSYSAVGRRSDGMARSVFLARLNRARIKAQNEMIMRIVVAVTTSGMLE